MGDADGGNVDASIDANEAELPDDKLPRESEDVDVYKPVSSSSSCSSTWLNRTQACSTC